MRELIKDVLYVFFIPIRIVKWVITKILRFYLYFFAFTLIFGLLGVILQLTEDFTNLPIVDWGSYILSVLLIILFSWLIILVICANIFRETKTAILYRKFMNKEISFISFVLIKDIQFDNSDSHNEDDVSSNHTIRKPIPQSVKDKVWNRDNAKCVQCGSNKNLEFDHIIPHSKGGADTYRNLQLLCEPCNRSKSAKIG